MMTSSLGQKLAISLMVLCTVLVGGCWDRAPVNELVIVLTVGIDAGSEPDTYAVTLEMVNPGAVGATGGGEGASLPSPTIITREGRTIMEAIQAIQRSVDRGIFLAQLQVVLFGEDLARTGISATLDHLQRNGEVRRTMGVAIARGSAREVMQSQGQTLTLLGISLDALFIQAGRTGYIGTIFGDFIQHLAEPGSSAVLPVIERSPADGALTVTGTAAFQGDRLVGIFDTRESQGLALVTRQAAVGLVLVGETDWSGERVLAAFALRRVNAPMEVRLVDGEPKATIDVRIEGVLVEQTGGGNFTASRDWSILEGMQEETVRSAVEATIKQAQEWKTDVFRIGNVIERRFPRDWQRVEEEWPELFSQMEIEVRVASRLLETGLTKEPIHILERD